MCLAGAVAASWSLMQEVAGSSPFTVMTKIFVTEVNEFSERKQFLALGKTQLYFCFSDEKNAVLFQKFLAFGIRCEENDISFTYVRRFDWQAFVFPIAITVH